MDNEQPLRPKRPRIVSRGNDHPALLDESEAFDYFVLDGPGRLSELKKKIEEREKVHFDLVMVEVSLDGNPETGEHDDTRTVGPDRTPLPCGCGLCELKRVRKLIDSNEYAIRKLRALYSRLQ